MDSYTNYFNEIEMAEKAQPSYSINFERRYLDIFCFPDGKVVFHGYYNHNYSFALFKTVWNEGVDYSELIYRILNNQWPCVQSYSNANNILGFLREEKYLSYRLSFFLNNNRVIRYFPTSKFELICEFEKVGVENTINESIGNIYANARCNNENNDINKLLAIKERIRNCTAGQFESVILPIEKELSNMQYIVFDNEHVRSVYQECWIMCENRYNEYMTLSRG